MEEFTATLVVLTLPCFKESFVGHSLAGWTMTSADKYCGGFIRQSEATGKCRTVPDIDVASGRKGFAIISAIPGRRMTEFARRTRSTANECTKLNGMDSICKLRCYSTVYYRTDRTLYRVFLVAVVDCRTHLLFTGDSRVASLHLDRLKASCRDSLFRNTALWTREVGQSFDSPPRSIANSLCLNDCTDNGVCSGGEWNLMPAENAAVIAVSLSFCFRSVPVRPRVRRVRLLAVSARWGELRWRCQQPPLL